MSVTLLFPGGELPISERPKRKVGGVRRRNESRQEFKQRMGGGGTEEIDAVFRGIQNTKGMVRRNLDGSIEDPNAPKGLDWLYAKNPHLAGAAQRQAQYDQQAREGAYGNAVSAVNERRELQKMQSQNPNLVTGDDGYRTLFDDKGKVIGTTRPMKSNAMWSQDDAINRGTASPNEHRDFASTLQQTGMDSVSGKTYKAPKGTEALFGENSSPPGGGNGGRVGPPASGAPGGETLFGMMPDVQSEGMPARGMPFPPNAGPMYPMMPANAGPQIPVGPPSPMQATAEQKKALADLAVMGNSAFRLADLYPGDDWEYLQMLFPQVNPAAFPTTNSLLDAYRQLRTMYR